MVFLPAVPCVAPSVWGGVLGLFSVSWFLLPSISLMFTNQLKVPHPNLPLLAHVTFPTNLVGDAFANPDTPTKATHS